MSSRFTWMWMSSLNSQILWPWKPSSSEAQWFLSHRHHQHHHHHHHHHHPLCHHSRWLPVNIITDCHYWASSGQFMQMQIPPTPKTHPVSRLTITMMKAFRNYFNLRIFARVFEWLLIFNLFTSQVCICKRCWSWWLCWPLSLYSLILCFFTLLFPSFSPPLLFIQPPFAPTDFFLLFFRAPFSASRSCCTLPPSLSLSITVKLSNHHELFRHTGM